MRRWNVQLVMPFQNKTSSSSISARVPTAFFYGTKLYLQNKNIPFLLHVYICISIYIYIYISLLLCSVGGELQKIRGGGSGGQFVTQAGYTSTHVCTSAHCATSTTQHLFQLQDMRPFDAARTGKAWRWWGLEGKTGFLLFSYFIPTLKCYKT